VTFHGGKQEDDIPRVPYGDELVRGHVVCSGRSGSYWYGPGRGWGTTFGVLDHSVAVYDSAVKARLAVRKGYGGKYPNRLKIVALRTARADEADRIERNALALLERVRILRLTDEQRSRRAEPVVEIGLDGEVVR
jgi:hypothetical protein